MSDISLNENAWNQLFQKYDILRCIECNGYFNISANEIKEFREPRLMSKFDHSKNLPKLFSENGLAILPITRGDYVISRFDAYHELESDIVPITQFSLPSHIQSLDYKNISSEAIALNCAFASGIIEDFIGEHEGQIVPTVSGRMGSGTFSFDIQEKQNNFIHHIKVNNSQIEIDAAYEGISSLSLFEAKMDISKDFMIRQLYYPFRVWQRRLTKPIKSIFFIYSNGIYNLYEYSFEDINNYNSLRFIKKMRYSIEDTDISVQDIQNVLDNVEVITEPELPFPQADKFDRIINLCELANIHELNRNYVTEKYDFDIRQTNYYTDAARYLGLLEKKKEDNMIYYRITPIGRKILKLGFKQRQLAYCHCILSHKAFNESLILYFNRGVMPSSDELIDIMKRSSLYNIRSENTFERRASTIKGWLTWIISLINT